MWSSRLRLSLTGLGHEAVVGVSVPSGDFDVALVNLSVADLRSLIPGLVESGVRVIGHAGHKEKELHALGKSLGCERVATNSELTFKLETTLRSA